MRIFRKLLASLCGALALLWVVYPGLTLAVAPPRPVLLSHPTFVALPQDVPFVPGQEGTFRFMLLGLDGLPMARVPVTVTVDCGRVVRFEERTPGLFEAVLLPTPLAPGATCTFQARAAIGEEGVSLIEPLSIGTQQQGVLKLTLSSPRLRLGKDKDVRLVIEGRLADGSPIQVEDLKVRTNVGTLEKLRTVAPGRVEGAFVPTDRRVPQVAIVSVFAGEQKQQLVAWSPLLLIGQAEVPVSTEPGSTVTADVAGERYGPFSVGASGELRIPIQVPPGVQRMGVQVRDAAGNVSRSTQDLGVPRFPRALMHFDRPIFRNDEFAPATLTILLVEEDGRPAALPRVTLKADEGHLGGLVELAPGQFSAGYLPTPRPGRHEVRLTIPRSDGSEEVHVASLDVREGVASRAELMVNPPVLLTDDPPAEVRLLIRDQAGNPVGGVQAELEAAVGSVEPFRQVGPGELVAAWRPPLTLSGEARDEKGQVTVALRAHVVRLAGEGPAAQVELGSEPLVVPVGSPVVQLPVLVKDRWGVPVKNVQVVGRLEIGSGSLGTAPPTDARGVTFLPFEAGRQVGPALVWVGLAQGTARSQRRVVLVTAGAPLEASLGRAIFGEADRTGAMVASAEVRVKAGLVKEIQISALPNVLYMDTRQQSRIRVRLVDRHGNYVVDPNLRLVASQGEVSPPRLTPDGSYEAVYYPPSLPTSQARASITVTNPVREYVGSTEVQLIRREGSLLAVARVGLISNLGAVLSPRFDLELMYRLPWHAPHLYAGVTGGYYYFTASRPDQTGSIRYDLFPIHLSGYYRLQVGSATPYLGLGPLVAVAVMHQNVLPGELSGVVPLQDVGFFPGIGGLLGLERSLGPGGVAVELGATLIFGQPLLGGTFDVNHNLGGLSIHAGYVGHF